MTVRIKVVGQDIDLHRHCQVSEGAIVNRHWGVVDRNNLLGFKTLKVPDRSVGGQADVAAKRLRVCLRDEQLAVDEQRGTTAVLNHQFQLVDSQRIEWDVGALSHCPDPAAHMAHDRLIGVCVDPGKPKLLGVLVVVHQIRVGVRSCIELCRGLKPEIPWSCGVQDQGADGSLAVLGLGQIPAVLNAPQAALLLEVGGQALGCAKVDIARVM